MREPLVELLDPWCKRIFEINQWESDYEVLINMELYKFLPRELIVTTLRPIYPELKMIGMTDYNNYGLSMEYELRSLEQRFNIVLYQTGDDSVIMGVDLTQSVDRASIQLELSAAKVEVVQLTPFNFLELRRENPPPLEEITLTQRLVAACIVRGGTDVHIAVGHSLDGVPFYYVSFRVGNDLIRYNMFKFDQALNRSLVYKLVEVKAGISSQDLSTIQGVVTDVTDLFGDGEITLRLTANTVLSGIMCVFRIQKVSTTSLKIRELGFPENFQDDLRTIALRTFGFSFITGAMRTGKNTTIFAIANEVSGRPISILGLDSPIETLMPFPQLDYKNDPQILREAIRRSKKQDLNLVLISELPDREVALAAKDLVNSSVHVITSFHINRIWHLPHKMKEFFGNDFTNIFTQLNLCATQKMFVKLCPHCKSVRSTETLPIKQRELMEYYEHYTYSFSNGCAVCDDENTPVKVQPYAEWILFTDEIISKMIELETPYKIERFLKELIMEAEPLEKSVTQAIAEGHIGITALDYLL